MITLITNSTILKYAFGYSVTISSLAFIEQELTQIDFFTTILNAIPSKIAVVLGIIYGVAIIFGKGSKEWKQHSLNVQEVRIGKEKLKQETIKTERMKIDRAFEIPVEYEEIEYQNNKIEDE
ncbi:hypothetical protein [Tenacibaculum sp. 190524A02b]|uniref:hypothetical protein n=1 Tax=Tenacibaculum vairaonense TaxID=3137860 RepID=UPI0031FB0CAB